MASPNINNWIAEIQNLGALNSNPINTNLATSTNYRFVCEKVPGGRVPSDISLRFIINDNFSNYMEMVRWMRSGVPYRDFKEIVPEYKGNVNHGKLFFLNNKKNPILMMTFSNLIPTQISGFTLSNTEADPTVMTATVNFVFDTYDIVKVS